MAVVFDACGRPDPGGHSVQLFCRLDRREVGRLGPAPVGRHGPDQRLQPVARVGARKDPPVLLHQRRDGSPQESRPAQDSRVHLLNRRRTFQTRSNQGTFQVGVGPFQNCL